MGGSGALSACRGLVRVKGSPIILTCCVSVRAGRPDPSHSLDRAFACRWGEGVCVVCGVCGVCVWGARTVHSERQDEGAGEMPLGPPGVGGPCTTRCRLPAAAMPSASLSPPLPAPSSATGCGRSSGRSRRAVMPWPLQARGDAVVQEGPESAYQVSEGVVVGPRPGVVQPTRAGRGLRGGGTAAPTAGDPGAAGDGPPAAAGTCAAVDCAGPEGGGGRGTRRGPAGSGGRVGGRRRCHRAAGRRLVGGDRGGGGEAAGRLGRRLPILPHAVSNWSRATGQGGYMVGGKGGVLCASLSLISRLST